jgi:hypothetical protein
MKTQYAQRRLREAIENMALSNCPLSERLARAFSPLRTLTPDDFPEEKMHAFRLEPGTRFDGGPGETCVETDMREEWRAIFAEVRKPEDGEYPQRMPEVTAANLIKRIIELHQRLTTRMAVDEWLLFAKQVDE